MQAYSAPAIARIHAPGLCLMQLGGAQLQCGRGRVCAGPGRLLRQAPAPSPCMRGQASAAMPSSWVMLGSSLRCTAANAACINTAGSFTCQCHITYFGNGNICIPELVAQASLSSAFFTNNQGKEGTRQLCGFALLCPTCIVAALRTVACCSQRLPRQPERALPNHCSWLGSRPHRPLWPQREPAEGHPVSMQAGLRDRGRDG